MKTSRDYLDCTLLAFGGLFGYLVREWKGFDWAMVCAFAFVFVVFFIKAVIAKY